MSPRSTATSIAAAGLIALVVPSGAVGAPAPKAMQAAWHGTSWSVPIELSGRAAANAEVRASSTCAIGRCAAEPTARAGGRSGSTPS